jgi:prepilin-type N-terminal cleavage/methylation domain-containing protein
MMNRHHEQPLRRTGFTLVEILFAMAIATFILAGILTSYIFCMKGFRSLSNYNAMQADGRQSLDWFARDVVASMAVSSCTSNQVVLLLPQTVNSAGVVTATNVVTHTIQNGGWLRTNGAGSTKQLAVAVASLTFSLYDTNNFATAVASQAASIQVDAILTNSVANNTQTSDFLSVRYLMRNKR